MGNQDRAGVAEAVFQVSPGEYIDNVLMTADRCLAALLGWSGKYTVSSECSSSPCRVCKVVRWLLGTKHCKDAAHNEGFKESK